MLLHALYKLYSTTCTILKAVCVIWGMEISVQASLRRYSLRTPYWHLEWMFVVILYKSHIFTCCMMIKKSRRTVKIHYHGNSAVMCHQWVGNSYVWIEVQNDLVLKCTAHVRNFFPSQVNKNFSHESALGSTIFLSSILLKIIWWCWTCNSTGRHLTD